ncbi:MAG TPA: hydrogenase maturation protease [Solirubrobacteraceae bacterium]|jgi:hydrogenase maturation protease|nr:hydrogenase maturation protease [Solirubrobacteraceae bacterium]
MRVLVGGVGYRFLRDGALGPYMADTLAPRAGNGVEVEDLGYHPVGFTQNLEERPDYDRIVFVAAVARGRAPGTVEAYRWDHALPPVKEIQDRVSEAVTGIISLDNLLIVSEAFGALPDDVRVVELEPADENWGEGFSPEVEAKLPEIEEVIWSLTTP